MPKQVIVSSSQLKKFASVFGKLAGVKWVTPGVINWVWNLLMNRVPRKYAKWVPDLPKKLHPHALKNLIVLTFCPGTSEATVRYQLAVLVEEVAHSFRIRGYVDDGGTVSRWYKEYFNPTDGTQRAIEEGIAKAQANIFLAWVFGESPEMPDLSGYLLDDAARASGHKAAKVYLDLYNKFGLNKSVPEVLKLAKQAAMKAGFASTN